jgi:hypothetical protein
MALFRGAVFHELCAGEQLQIFNPAICGQAKEFALDKRAEMWRWPFQAGANVLSSD